MYAAEKVSNLYSVVLWSCTIIYTTTNMKEGQNERKKHVVCRLKTVSIMPGKTSTIMLHGSGTLLSAGTSSRRGETKR